MQGHMQKNQEGRYRSFPIPEEWGPTLQGLQPRAEETPSEPCTREVRLGRCLLIALDDRQRLILQALLVEQKAVSRIAHEQGLRAQQVKGLEAESYAKLAQQAEQLEGGLQQACQLFLGKRPRLIRWEAEESLSMLALAGMASQHLPGACRLVRFGKGRDGSEEGVLRPAGWPDEQALIEAMKSRKNFMWTEELEQRFGLDREDIEALPSIARWLRLSNDGLSLSHRRIDQGEAIRGTARALSRAGFKEWHTSELVKAAHVLNPSCATITASTYSNMLSAARMEGAYQKAGRKGYWKLAEEGDGYGSNREAVAAILKGIQRPMHWKDIQQRLSRNIDPRSLLALMIRDDHFKTYGNGHFGLAGAEYAQPKAEETFMMKLFEEHNHEPLREEIVQAAWEAQGGRLVDLISAAQLSTKFRHFKLPWAGRWFTTAPPKRQASDVVNDPASLDDH